MEIHNIKMPTLKNGNSITNQEYSNKKKDNSIYLDQLQKLVHYFSLVEEGDIRDHIIKLTNNITKMEKKAREQKENKIKIISEINNKRALKRLFEKNPDNENLNYINKFSKYLNKTNSVVIKDQIIEMVKMMVG